MGKVPNCLIFKKIILSICLFLKNLIRAHWVPCSTLSTGNMEMMTGTKDPVLRGSGSHGRAHSVMILSALFCRSEAAEAHQDCSINNFDLIEKLSRMREMVLWFPWMDKTEVFLFLFFSWWKLEEVDLPSLIRAKMSQANPCLSFHLQCGSFSWPKNRGHEFQFYKFRVWGNRTTKPVCDHCGS